MAARFMTIGHSNRPLEVFLDMLRDAAVECVIDVRAFPKSRANPAFNIDRLPADLAGRRIGYRHCPALGGRRQKRAEVAARVNAFWRVQSFHNYADYALGDAFGAAFDALVRAGRERRLAIMCSEAVWWRCHRRIIADYLLMHGHDVAHLMGPGRTSAARLTPGARQGGHGRVVYPAPQDGPDTAGA